MLYPLARACQQPCVGSKSDTLALSHGSTQTQSHLGHGRSSGSKQKSQLSSSAAAADTSIEEEGNLVDGSGLYLAGCPMKHNADSPALENYQDVVIYFGSGRRAIGFPKGMLYLMKEAFIISIGRPSIMNTPKTEQLWIQ